MILRTALFLLLAVGSQALKTLVSPGRTECFTESVEPFHFTVPGGPRIDGRVLVSGKSQYYVPFVTVRVLGTKGEQLWEQQHVYTEAHFNLPASGPGTYQVCFFNPHDSRTDAVIDLVYFALAHLRTPPGKVVIPKGTADTRTKEVAHKEHMEEVQRTIMSMSEFVQVIGGSQRYLQRKLDRHFQTVVSNKDRTLWYALLEVLALLAVMGVQVFAITKLFEGTRARNILVV